MFLTWAWLCSRVYDPWVNDPSVVDPTVFEHPLGWDRRIWECDRVSFGWQWVSPAKAVVELYTSCLPFHVIYWGGNGPGDYEDRYYGVEIVHEIYYNIILAKERYQQLRRTILLWEERY